MKKLKLFIIFLSIFLIITPIKTNAATTFGDLLDDLEELKEQKNQSQQAVEALQHENEQLRNEHRNWQEHIRSLLGKFDNV